MMMFFFEIFIFSFDMKVVSCIFINTDFVIKQYSTHRHVIST